MQRCSAGDHSDACSRRSVHCGVLWGDNVVLPVSMRMGACRQLSQCCTYVRMAKSFKDALLWYVRTSRAILHRQWWDSFVQQIPCTAYSVRPVPFSRPGAMNGFGWASREIFQNGCYAQFTCEGDASDGYREGEFNGRRRSAVLRKISSAH